MTLESLTHTNNASVSKLRKNNKKILTDIIIETAYKKFLKTDAVYAEKTDVLFALNYIHAHLLSPSLSVQRVIAECRIRTHSLHERFADEIVLKKDVRQTPGEYIKWARIQVARHILDNSNCYMKELAYRVGFGSYSPFYRACCKYMDCKPSNFFDMNSKIC